MAQLTPEQRAALIDKIRSQGIVQKAIPVESDYFSQSIQDPKHGLNVAGGGVAAVGEAVDSVTGAPIRAGVGNLSLRDMGKQYKAGFTTGKVLPTTPSGKDIVRKLEIAGGVNPAYAETASSALGPVVDAGLDPTVMAGFLPGKVMTGAARGVGELAKGASSASEVLGNAAARGVFTAGKLPTLGALDIGKSMEATKGLSAFEQIAPQAYMKANAQEIQKLKDLTDLVPIEMRDPKIQKQLVDAINKSEDLSTAAKTRGFNPVTAYITKGADQAMDPINYHRGIGIARTPKAAFDATLKLGGKIADKYPGLTEVALRDAALAPGRTYDNPIDVQTIYQDENMPMVNTTKKRKK